MRQATRSQVGLRSECLPLMGSVCCITRSFGTSVSGDVKAGDYIIILNILSMINLGRPRRNPSSYGFFERGRC